MQEKIQELLLPYSEYTDGLFVLPSADYDYKHWNTFGRAMICSNIFGCDADYTAWNTKAAGQVVDASTHPERYFGGHIHFSGHPLFESDPILAIKIFAITVGLAASGNSPVPDLEARRTFLYGKLDKYRPQNYPDGSVGVEYRTPSNIWTGKGNEAVAEKLFYYADLAINSLMNQVDKAEKLVEELHSVTEKAILSCDQSKCKELLAYVESKV